MEYCDKCYSANARYFDKLGMTLCLSCVTKSLKEGKDAITNIDCESCNSRDARQIAALGNKVLCPSCLRATVQSSTVQVQVEQKKEEKVLVRGDIYNLKIASIQEMKLAIDADDSIPADSKAYKFHEALADRYHMLSTAIFERDRLNHEDSVEKIAINKTLQEFTASVREEIRKKIAESDAKYQPVSKAAIKPKVEKKVDTFERAVQALATALNIPLYEARERITKGLVK